MRCRASQCLSGAHVRRPPVERLHGSLQRVPLLGTLSNKAIEILFGIQEYYTYTSAS